jgi:hypothetical protein
MEKVVYFWIWLIGILFAKSSKGRFLVIDYITKNFSFTISVDFHANPGHFFGGKFLWMIGLSEFWVADLSKFRFFFSILRSVVKENLGWEEQFFLNCPNEKYLKFSFRTQKTHNETSWIWHRGWIPRLIAHLQKIMFAIPDFVVAFGWPTPMDTNFFIFQKSLEVSNFGRSYLKIWLADLDESIIVGKAT